MIFIYFLFLLVLTIFSYGFVDANFPYNLLPIVFKLVHTHRRISMGIYVGIISGLFGVYFWFMRQAIRGKISNQYIWKIIFLSCIVLLFSFPAFSYDIFNYMATAKVAFFYKENPYIVMPIEIKNEPLLSFMHASNKVALYGPVWIALTAIPHFLGAGNLLLTIFLFKMMAVGFYIGLVMFIWQISEKKVAPLVFFAFNPLVLIETLISGHNDVVMMVLAVASYMALQKRKIFICVFLLLLSIGIKGATVALIPLWMIGAIRRIKINKERIIQWSAIALFGVFLLSPLREEMYPWYFIWPLSFVSLMERPINLMAIALSYGLEFRFAPFIYFGMWGGWVPLIKNLVTIGPLGLTGFYYAIRKKI